MKKTVILSLLTVVFCALLALSANAGSMTANAEYTTAPPTMTADVLDESWGGIAAHVDKDSPNSELHVYKKGLHPEDGLDIYARWDDSYLYICFVSPDDDPNGTSEYWKGDGFMSVMYAGDDIHYDEDNACFDMTYSWTTSVDLKNVNTYGGATKCDPTIAFRDGLMIAKIRIPLSDLGFSKNEDKTDKTVAVRLVRISARTGENFLSGWLAWGKFYESAILPTEPDTLADGSNFIKLVKTAGPAVQEEPVVPAEPTEPTEPTASVGEPVFVFDENDRPSEYATAEVTAAINAGLVPSNLCENFTSPVTRGAVAGMFVRLIEEASGKTVDEILDEKGLPIEEDVFTDTSDRNVLAAHALGIINGTGDGKFSPDGTLKRAQIAAIINRVAKVMGIETSGYTHPFTDITDNYAWADAELGWPVHAGIINGVGEGRFNPAGELKTQDAILITYRALKALETK